MDDRDDGYRDRDLQALPGHARCRTDGISSILLLPLSLYFGEPLSAPAQEIAVMVSFGLLFAIAAVTLVLGARSLPSSETALISTLEAPLAILFAWLLLAEIPALATAVGGSLILVSVIASQVITNGFYNKSVKPDED